MTVEMVLFVLGLALGGVINWWFARQSSEALRVEAQRLRAETLLVRQAVNALGDALELGGWVELHHDAQGNIDGLRMMRRTIDAQLSSVAARGTGTVTPSSPRPSVFDPLTK